MKRLSIGSLLVFMILVGLSSNVHANGRVETAFRVSDLKIQSPRILGSAFFDMFWIDATDSINDELYWNLREDAPEPDGFTDINILYHFKRGRIKATEGLCHHGSQTKNYCKPGKKVDHYSSEIMALDPAEFWGYEYVTMPEKVTIDVIGVKVKAEYGQIVFLLDTEANEIRGKVFCFLSLEKAKTHRMPYWLSYVGDKTLDVILSSSDLDVGHHGEKGWWFTLDFVAEPIAYVQ